LEQNVLISRPLVTVIMPAYNCERFVGEALSSLIREEYSPLEIIVIDDGSTDETACIINGFKEVFYVYQEHLGVSVARNTAIALSKGEFIAFLDSDDIWLTGWLYDAVTDFLLNPDLDYLMGMHETFFEEDFVAPAEIRQVWMDDDKNPHATGVIMARRDCFERIGGFNVTMVPNEDVDWLVRASDHGLTMKRVPFNMMKKRMHGWNLSITDRSDHKEIRMRIAIDSIRRRRAKELANDQGKPSNTNSGMMYE